ncbi:cytochrome P450 monooxygenase pc-1 [Coprinopsis cinerea AmutBmut pab1-1]|nr:cytochrome P450 monooxygenase pc-1 [Coprinopsis cinerea AmutBmut pab1-1]
MPLSPGLVFLGKRSPSLVLPPLLTYGALHVLDQTNILTLPTWAVISLVALAKPIHYACEVYHHRYRVQREAKKRGAKVVPHIEEPWPYFSGLSIIPYLMDSYLNGYVLDSVQEWVGKYGHTFELRLPSENQIWTTEPEHVKAMLAPSPDPFSLETESVTLTFSINMQLRLWNWPGHDLQRVMRSTSKT